MSKIACTKTNKVYNKKTIVKGTMAVLITVLMAVTSVAVSADIEGAGPQTLPDQDVFFRENFENDGAWPDGWEVISTAPPTWSWKIYSDDPLYIHGGDYCAYIMRRTSGQQDEILLSPTIDLRLFEPETTNITVTFWAYSKNSTQNTVKLRVIGDGIDDIIWEMSDEWWEGYGHREVGIDDIGNLDPYIGEEIQLAWHYEGLAGKSFWLDDIKIFAGEYIPPPEEPEMEIGAIMGGSGVVTAVVKNIGDPEGDEYGRTRDVKDVTCRISITGGIRGGIDVENTDEFDKIEAGEEKTGSASGFFGLGRVTIDVRVKATLDEDEWPKQVDISRQAQGFVLFRRFLPISF